MKYLLLQNVECAQISEWLWHRSHQIQAILILWLYLCHVGSMKTKKKETLLNRSSCMLFFCRVKLSFNGEVMKKLEYKQNKTRQKKKEINIHALYFPDMFRYSNISIGFYFWLGFFRFFLSSYRHRTVIVGENFNAINCIEREAIGRAYKGRANKVISRRKVMKDRWCEHWTYCWWVK